MLVSRAIGTQTEDANSVDFSSATSLTPSERKRKSGDANTCKKCHQKYGSKMDRITDSIWINFGKRSCNYWAHLKYLGFCFQEKEHETQFAEKVQFICKAHLEVPKARKVL